MTPGDPPPFSWTHWPPPSVTTVLTSEPARLSDEDVERIAKRVMELLAEWADE